MREERKLCIYCTRIKLDIDPWSLHWKKNWFPFDQQKNPNDLDILAFWLANTSRLLHDMKQYSGDKVSLFIVSIGSITDRWSHMEPTPPSRPYSRIRSKPEPTALKFTFNMITKGLTTHTSRICFFFNFFNLIFLFSFGKERFIFV